MDVRAVIVDDEPLARQELQYLLEDSGQVEIVAQASNGIEAVEIIRRHQPDVIFLDIQMPGLDGFAVLKKLIASRIPLPQIVFATAFDQHAVRAFEVNAVDYLLKPFDRKRVLRTVTRVSALKEASGSHTPAAPTIQPDNDRPLPSHERATTPPEHNVKTGQAERQTSSASREPHPETLTERAGALLSALSVQTEAKLDALLRMVSERVPHGSEPSVQRTGKIVVRTQNRLLLVDQREICFASIEEGAISVVTPTMEGLANCRTLEELMEQMDPLTFWRVHRSYLVNIQHIREVVPWFKSSYQLRMDDRRHTEIPVSRAQTKRLRELFNL
jgi:two-component system response regulator LytT